MPKPKTSSAKPSHNKSSKSAKASTGKRGKRPSSAVVGGTSPAAAAAPKPRRAAGADQAQPHLNNNNNFFPADVGTKSPPSEPMTARPLSAPLQRRTSSTIYSHNVSPPVAHTPQTISINRPRSNTNTNVTAATSTTTMEDRQISTSPPPRPPAATPSSRPRTPPMIPARADGSRGPHEDGVVARYASLRPIESVSPRPRPHSSMHQLTGQALTAAMLAQQQQQQQQQQQPPQQQGDVEQPDVSPAPAFCSGLTEFQAREVLSDKDSGSLNSSFSDSPRSPHRSALPTQRSVILSTSMAAGSISNLRCETSMLGSPRGEAAEALRMQRCMDATRRLGDTSEVAHLIHNAHTKAPLHEEELRPTHRPTSASGTTAGTPGVPRLALAQSSRRSQQEQDEGRAQAIRGLSLYDAFILDRQRKVWVVDDRVLAKCLDYLRLMGYTHPQLKRDRAKGVPSLWSSSAVIPSPLISAQQQQQQQQQQQDQEQSQDKDEVRRPYALRHPPSSEASRHGALFLTQAEAMRWVSEQEYVLGTILLCCAKAGRRGAAPTPDDEVLGCIPPKTHPILFTAELILKSYPQWGTFESFLEVWERQVRLVLCPAAPAHQRSFSTFDGITFSSDMEGGNLQRVERAAESGNYYLWLDPDLGSDKRIWFRFAVVGAKEGRILHFRLLNAAPHAKLYKQNGMCPVWRDGASVAHWTAVEQCQFRLTPSEDAAELQFSIIPRSSTDTIQVAFCPPYTYADLLCHISQWHMLVKTGAANIRFEERVLCRSPDGRKLHLLVLTSPTQSTTSPQLGRKIVGGSAFSKASLKARGAGGAAPASPLLASVVSKAMVERPYSNFASGKKVVLISGRVHPGEITASHALHGIITFLLSSHPRAIALREHFLFFIIPMINPDGVSRGHSRMDQYGINLNRCYNDPEPTTQPTVLALKNVFDHLQRTFRERFIMYLDFHSHASQSSGFIFGNYLPNTVQPFNMGYTKLVELHSRKLFAFSLCRFGRGHMTSKDGTSRVLFGCGLVHSYTVELTHFTDRRLYADTIEAINSGDSVVRGGEDAAGAAGGKAGAEAKKGGKAAAGGARGSVVVSNNNNSSSAPEVRSRYPSAGKAPSSQSGRKVESLKKHRSEVIPTKLKDRMRLPISVRQSTAPATTSMEKEGSSERKASTFVPRRREGKSGPTLACITFPSILRQSAMVGEACMLALHDYCLATARPSQELVSYGGYEKVMAEMKAHIRESSRGAGGKKSPVKYAIQPIFKQY